MPIDLSSAVVPVAAWAMTYLLHSTLTLGAAWLALRGRRAVNPWLAEQTWKAAAILPLFTATWQCASPMARPVWEMPLSAGQVSSAESSLPLIGQEWIVTSNESPLTGHGETDCVTAVSPTSGTMVDEHLLASGGRKPPGGTLIRESPGGLTPSARRCHSRPHRE